MIPKSSTPSIVKVNQYLRCRNQELVDITAKLENDLKECATYLDAGDYKGNETQYNLWIRICSTLEELERIRK